MGNAKVAPTINYDGRIMQRVQQHPIISFPTAEEWRAWLAKNHKLSNGVQLRMFKKGSGQQSIAYDKALDEALCFGWIDGQKKTYDEQSWIQKFTPRRPKSTWSKRNREHIERLTNERRMKPAGLKAVEAAKNDGRWDSAYDPPSAATIPADFLQALSKNKKAKAFFETLNKANLYSIAWRLQTAKTPETREKRMKVILAMMAEGKKFSE